MRKSLSHFTPMTLNTYHAETERCSHHNLDFFLVMGFNELGVWKSDNVGKVRLDINETLLYILLYVVRKIAIVLL